MFREDENLYKTIFYIIPDAVILIDNKGFMAGMNDKVEKWLGYNEDEVIGKHILKLKFIGAKSKIIIAKKFADRMLGREVEPYEIEFKAKNGEIKKGLIRGSVIKDDNGDIKSDLILITDITNDDFLSARLADAKRKYKYLFDSLPYGFAYHKMIFDDKKKPIDYVFEEVNNNFEKLTGLKANKLIGKKVTEVIKGIEKDKTNWIEKYGQVVLTRQPMVFESYEEALQKWFKIAAYSPEEGYFVTIFYDITEDKKNEQEFKEIASHISEKVEEVSMMNIAMQNREKKLAELKEALREKH